jgi:hypothetical protein
MWSERARLFRKTCELIADDRRRVGRDYSHHRYLVDLMDAAAGSLLAGLKRITAYSTRT